MQKPQLTTIILGIVVVLLTVLAFVLKDKQTEAPQACPPITRPPSITPPPSEPKWTLEDAVNSITQEECKKHLYKLADNSWEGRMSGKKGNVLAAAYIKDEFEKAGLKTEYQKFRIQRMNPGPKNETGDDFTQNIYGWIEGSDPYLKNEIIVIGAHMDHIGYGPKMSRTPNRREVHPGADDNASGTVALIEMARAFAMLKPKRTVVLQAYSAEEMGLIGSRYYCNNPTFPKNGPNIKKHIFMLNMDMIGHLGGRTAFAVTFHDGNSSPDVKRYIEELNHKYSFGKRITSTRGSGSDHVSFYNNRVPVGFLHTGVTNTYHTPHDTADSVDCYGLQKVAQYGFELAWKIANEPAAPTFNHASFKELDYTHDHGYLKFHGYHKEGQ
jgi:hypothetical protein